MNIQSCQPLALLITLSVVACDDTKDHNGDHDEDDTASVEPILPTCTAATTPTLPDEPMESVQYADAGLRFGFVGCYGADWWVKGSSDDDDAPLDAVSAQVWDLSTGTLLGSWPMNSTDGGEDWDVKIPESAVGVSCPMSNVGVVLTGEYNGEPVQPEGCGTEEDWESRGFGYSGSRYELDGMIDGADEMWGWILYPTLEESYGPFEMTYDTEKESFGTEINLNTNQMDTGGVAVGFIACGEGEPIDAVVQ